MPIPQAAGVFSSADGHQDLPARHFQSPRGPCVVGGLPVPGGHNGVSGCCLPAAESHRLCMGFRTAALGLEFSLFFL